MSQGQRRLIKEPVGSPGGVRVQEDPGGLHDVEATRLGVVESTLSFNCLL